MPYSLVSAATLGFDLVRLPAGRTVADVLLTALAADAAGLRSLADAHPARGRGMEERTALLRRSRIARALALEVPSVRSLSADAGVPADQSMAVVVAQLERGTIGNVTALERLLREDVLGPEHPGGAALTDHEQVEVAEVLGDAVVAAWAADILPPALCADLIAPFAAAGLEATALPDLGPATPQLRELMVRVRALDARGRARWRAVVDDTRGERRPWAAAMHEAAWAAHVSGRTRVLAVAQLCAVQAFLDGGFDARDGAQGVWNALAGCVQGLAMADLLDDHSSAVLTGPWARVSPAG